MTLAELMKKAQAVNSQLSTAWIPLKLNGKDVDIDLVLSEDKDGLIVNVELNN